MQPNSLKYLSEALPTSGRALFLKKSFNQSLINSLKYLLEICREVIPSQLFLSACQKLDSLNPQSKLSGLLSLLNLNLFNAAEQNQPEIVQYIGDRLSKDNFESKNLNFVNVTNLNEYYSPFVMHIFSHELKREIKFFPLPQEDFEKAKNSIQRGINILKCSFPNFFSEFDELVSEILILKSQGLKQGSSSDLFGMIYKSSLFRSNNVTDAIDFLIHEQSHLYVYLLNKDDPMLLNPMQLNYSPLREEERPLMGIYHATFVLARMQYVLKQALSLGEIPEDEKDYCKDLINFYKKCFYESFDILQKHAQMTPLGSALIHSASRLV